MPLYGIPYGGASTRHNNDSHAEQVPMVHNRDASKHVEKHYCCASLSLT